MWRVEFEHQIRYVDDPLELVELIIRLLRRNLDLELRIRRLEK